MARGSLARSVAADVAVWHAPSLAFLGVYVFRFGAPVMAAAWHLAILFVFYLGIAAVRLALRLLKPGERAVRVASSALLASWSFLLLAFYLLTLMWMDTVRRLLNWKMLSVFLQQLPYFADAFEIPRWGAAAAVLLLWLLLAWVAWVHLGRWDWTSSLHGSLAPARAAALSAALLPACAWAGNSLLLHLPLAALEPLSATFQPGVISPQVGEASGESAARSSRSSAAEVAAIEAYRPSPTANGRNLIIVVVDALRPDHMGVYGYGRDTTPRLERLMREHASRRVDGMRAVCGESECGLRGLFSSKYVNQFSQRMFNLTDAVRRHGYRIHLILSGDHSNFYGLRESYGRVDTYYDGSMAAAAGEYSNGDAFLFERLRAIPAFDGTPTMFQFHLMPTHPFGFQPSRPQPFQPAHAYALPWQRKAFDDPGATLETAVNFYDNGVLEADRLISQLVSALAAKGYLDNALLVVTADHGEALGEHGTYSHARNVWDQALRIPLIFVSFGRSPVSPFAARRASSQVDIAPTLLAELGMPEPPTWEGVPLQRPAGRRITWFQERDDVGLVERDPSGRLWKYWKDWHSGQEFAFAIEGDPGERHNLIAALPEGTKRRWRRKTTGH